MFSAFHTLFKCLHRFSQGFQWRFPKTHMAFLRCQAVCGVSTSSALPCSSQQPNTVTSGNSFTQLGKDRAEIQKQAVKPWRPHPYSQLNLLIIETGTMLSSILEMTNTQRVDDFPHLSKLKRKKEPASLILGRFEQTSTHSSWE